MLCLWSAEQLPKIWELRRRRCWMPSNNNSYWSWEEYHLLSFSRVAVVVAISRTHIIHACPVGTGARERGQAGILLSSRELLEFSQLSEQNIKDPSGDLHCKCEFWKLVKWNPLFLNFFLVIFYFYELHKTRLRKPSLALLRLKRGRQDYNMIGQSLIVLSGETWEL